MRARIQKQIQGILSEQSLLKNRVGVKSHLSEHDQLVYYSSWIFGAVHALVSVPGFQTAENIARHLGINVRQASDALEFLLNSGLLNKNNKGLLRVGKSQIHIGIDSPSVTKHHINWRLQAIRILEHQEPKNLHYSSVVSVSVKDIEKIRGILIESIRTIKAVIKDSSEEEVRCFNIDLFEI